MPNNTGNTRNRLFICLLLFLTSGLTLDLLAQHESVDQSGERFIRQLTTPEHDQGRIRIYQDSRIVDKIGSRRDQINLIKEGNKTLVKTNGWRIQIFSGNDQATAKEEAFRKEAIVKAKLPDLNTYVMYNAPFWRVRLGDFFTYEEAYEVLLDLRKSFVFGREMSIVREKIQVEL